MARTKNNPLADKSTANLGFEAKLWLTADNLRHEDSAFLHSICIH